jgi:deoxyuridine 5'-triphosphate nucleotidohydrolase
MISERQAYIMGWVQNWDDKVPAFLEGVDDGTAKLAPDGFLRLYDFAKWDQLDHRRRIDYLRGVIDHHAQLKDRHGTTPASICLSKDLILRPEILGCVAAAFTETDDVYIWSGVNAIDLLGELLYTESEFFEEKVLLYLSQISLPLVEMPSFKWERGLPDAIPPTKNRYSDSGYDLTLIKRIKEKNGVIFYDTGIKVEPDTGYYFELVGRSSISKTGWMLANNIGIIDASYRGNIIVALTSGGADVPEIELPNRLVQLIPRNLILMKPIEARLNDTVRADGGFGSSGK